MWRLRDSAWVGVVAGLATCVAASEPCPICGRVHGDGPSELVQLVNAERQRRGLHPLREVNCLGADLHAVAMASRRSMYHAGRYAENVAVGQQTPRHVMRSWMSSSGHRANILGRRYREIDVGRQGRYWVQRFR